MRSMTGFGQGSAENERLRVQVTLRTVNHRYLDLSMRLREDLRASEKRLRDAITGRLERGRVEVSLAVEALAEQPVELSVNRAAIDSLQQLQRNLVSEGVVESGLSLADILRTPEIVRLELGSLEWQDADLELLLDAAERALDQVVEGRELEGGQLRSALLQRIDKLEVTQRSMAQRAGELPNKLRETLHERISSALDGQPIDADRLAQEVALLADRSDISEELDRLASHLMHFREVIEHSGSIGKRLDFLSQEIFRELNTMGSKCRNSELVKLVLDGKVLCEQLREQVQNVE